MLLKEIVMRDDLDMILNEAINIAFQNKKLRKSPFSNNIAAFVSNFLEERQNRKEIKYLLDYIESKGGELPDFKSDSHVCHCGKTKITGIQCIDPITGKCDL